MKKLILDPCLFETSCLENEKELEHYLLLYDTIAFLAKHFDCGLDTYDGASYGYNSKRDVWMPPITNSLTIKNSYSEIRKNLQKMICLGEELELKINPVDICALQFEEDSAARESFLQYLSYLIESKTLAESVIVLSSKNSACTPSVYVNQFGKDYQIASIYNPAVDCNGIVKTYLKKDDKGTEAFPQKTACEKLNQRFLEEVKLSPNRASVYLLFGAETASRNSYQKDTVRSKKNAPHHVYKSEYEVFFLSFDMEHGALELFEKRGNSAVHQGEYNYSCEKIKAASPRDHTLTL